MFKCKWFLVSLLLIMVVSPAFAGKGGGGSSAPTYYSFEDLRSGLKNESFYFSNASRPSNAMVNLGFTPIFAASAPKRAAVRATVLSNAARYRVSSKVVANWVDTNDKNYDWGGLPSYGGARGDLIFLRASGKGPDVVKMFSNWTHVAIVENISRQQVFESMPDGGVRINNAPASWGRVSYYSTKKLSTVAYPTVCSLVDDAERRYIGTPYYPRVLSTSGVGFLLTKWSNKNDMESMYCSKLVYHTFKSYVNFDTNNTSIYSNSQLQDSAPGAPFASWIGVSPDDVYYSTVLSYDYCYSPNLWGI
jgi:hypothetical protein